MLDAYQRSSFEVAKERDMEEPGVGLGPATGQYGFSLYLPDYLFIYCFLYNSVQVRS